MGRNAGAIKLVFSPKRKGQGRAGIARPGMIVTSEGLMLEALAKDPSFSLLQDLAHEIAHFWWNFGEGQGDWINEAFAEYASAVAVEQLVSEEQFQKVLEGYRSTVRALPGCSLTRESAIRRVGIRGPVLQRIANAGLDPTDDGKRCVCCRSARIFSDLYGEVDWNAAIPQLLEREAGQEQRFD
jgi:hypothetical protein